MKLPKTAYIRIQKEGDESWLQTDESLDGHAELGEKRTVGIYKLIETVELTTEVKTRKK